MSRNKHIDPTYSKHGWLLGISALGLLLRLLFLWKGATLYYGPGQEHLNGDSSSFIDSFLTLWQTGHYTSEPLIPDASFGRLPGYPFFYGLHHVLFGPQLVVPALCVTQALLDTAVIALFYNLMLRWTGRVWAARIAALLYATYPFAVAWVSVVGSESLNTFCTVVWLSVITRAGGRRHYLLVGLLSALAFYVREFMGILLPIAAFFVWLLPQRSALASWQRVALVVAGFGMLYVWWPLRNYVNHNRVVLVKPVAAGYANQREDMQAYLDWLHCWTNDNTTWLERLLANKPFRYPTEIFSGPAEERRAYALTELAARCGSSFHMFRIKAADVRMASSERFCNCDEQLTAGFDSLRLSYMRRQPVEYQTVVPLANLHKAFFKSSTVHAPASAAIGLLQRIFFNYRTLLLLAGIVGLVMKRRKPAYWPVAAYFCFIYAYISYDFRSLEMRYLLQADALLLLPAAQLVAQLVQRRLSFRGVQRSNQLSKLV